MTETGSQRGVRWVKESLALFRTQPHVWMLCSLAYIVIFMMLSLPFFGMLRLLSAVIWPVCMVFIVMLYRQMDLQGYISPSLVWEHLQKHLKVILCLGASCLAYAFLTTSLLGSDIADLISHAPTKAGMTESQMTQYIESTLSFLIKVLLLSLPLFIATWFSPMLISFNGYSLLEAIKSSIAGTIKYAWEMTYAWLLMTVGLIALMLGLGVVFALIGYLLPGVVNILIPLSILVVLLAFSAIMFAFQYISYKDVFRAAPQV